MIINEKDIELDIFAINAKSKILKFINHVQKNILS